MHRNATPAPFTPAAAREADRLDRKLSAESALRLLSRIERLRRDEEVRELRGQLEELRFELAVISDPTQRRAREALVARIEAYIARATGGAA